MSLWQRIGINGSVILASIGGVGGGFLLGREYYRETILKFKRRETGLEHQLERERLGWKMSGLQTRLKREDAPKK